jgi:hypothetical protein
VTTRAHAAAGASQVAFARARSSLATPFRARAKRAARVGRLATRARVGA